MLLTQLAEKPNLAGIQDKHPLAEAWPVLLADIKTFRSQMQHFVISDGQTQTICTTTLPDVEAKIKQMELGSIIHVIGAEIKYSEAHKQYVVDVQEVCTLKEYDDRIKEQAEIQRQRQEWLKQQQEKEEALLSANTVDADTEKEPALA